jgi:hypothetical protein
MAKQPRKTLAPTQTPATMGAPDAAAAMAAHVTGAEQAPAPAADAPAQVATGEPVADPAQTADNGPTPPETGTEGTATAGAGQPVPASVTQPLLDPDLTGFDLSAKGPDGLQVTVIGPAKGRWRAGRHFTPVAVVINASEITGAEAKLLAEDPELVCVWDKVVV